MSTTTAVRVNTYTHSVAYITDQLLNSIQTILVQAGLDLDNFLSDWESTERAIKTWLTSKHLEKITVEIYDPITSNLLTRWDMDVDYTTGSSADGTFWADSDALAYAIRKCGKIPSSCKYKLIIKNKEGRPDVPGWSSTQYRSLGNLTNRSIGTTADAGGLGTGVSYWS